MRGCRREYFLIGRLVLWYDVQIISQSRTRRYGQCTARTIMTRKHRYRLWVIFAVGVSMILLSVRKLKTHTPARETLLYGEMFSSIRAKLNLVISDCEGEHNAKRCGSDVLKQLCLSDVEVRQPVIQYTDSFTPWLTLGNFTWTANNYTDFIVWYIFFSGKLFSDKGKSSTKREHFYFESGASNGIHASQTYTLGEQLLWKGLITEVSNCGPCQARVNHPSAEFIHAGICEVDSVINSDPKNHATFCPKQIDCDYPDFSTVACRSLRSLFAERDISWVDFLSLDMEEATTAAWHSVDHKLANIRVATVEKWPNMFVDKGIFQVVEAAGDFFIWKKGAFKLVENPCKHFL